MIKIGEDYAIGSTPLSIILYKKRIGKRGKSEGKELWSELAYFATPHNALDYLVELQVRETEFKDLKTVCSKMDEIYDLIKGWELSLEMLQAVRKPLKVRDGSDSRVRWE